MSAGQGLGASVVALLLVAAGCTADEPDEPAEPYRFETSVTGDDEAAVATRVWTWGELGEGTARIGGVDPFELVAVDGDPCLRVVDAYGDRRERGVVWPEGTVLDGDGLRIEERVRRAGSRVELAVVEAGRDEVERSLVAGQELRCTADDFVVVIGPLGPS